MTIRKTKKPKKSNKKIKNTTIKNKKNRSKKCGGGHFFSQPARESPEVCPICREVLNDNYITTECGHTFDIDCLSGWCRQYREDTTCPICRESIGPICKNLLLTNLEKILFDAIKTGEIDFAEQALADRLNNDGTEILDHNGIPLLNINVKDKEGNTPLILAAQNEDYEIVELLLRQDAEVDELNDDGDAAFHVTDNNDIINLLIEHGTEFYDPEEDAINHSIFGFENSGGNRKMKKSNMKTRKKRSKKCGGGHFFSQPAIESPDDVLIDAAQRGEADEVRTALKNNANVNAKSQGLGNTALIQASRNGFIHIVRILLSQPDIDVDATSNSSGMTALMHASQNKHTNVVKLLKQYIVAQTIPRHFERQQDKENLSMVISKKNIGNRGDGTMPHELRHEIMTKYLGGKRKNRKTRRK